MEQLRERTLHSLGGADDPSREQLLEPMRAPVAAAQLGRPITDFSGVGPALAAKAAKLGIVTVGDLLDHLPFDYRDYEHESPRRRPRDR